MVTKKQFYDEVVKKHPEIEWPDEGWVDDCVIPFYDGDEKCGCWIMESHNIVVKDVGVDEIINEASLKEATTWCIGRVTISNFPTEESEEADDPIGTLKLDNPSLDDIVWDYDKYLDGFKSKEEADAEHARCLEEVARG